MKDYELAFALFAAAKGAENEDIYGVNAIQEYIKAKKTIPDVLVPLVLKTCDAWKEKTGNKGRIRKIETKAKWNRLIVEVRCAFLANRSNKINGAIEQIAAKHDLNVETLKDYHDSPKYKSARKAGDIHYNLTKWAIDPSQDLQKLYYQNQDNK